MAITLDDRGYLTVPATLSVLGAAAEARARDRYLPVDAPFESSTSAELVLGLPAGPRALGYGPPGDWCVPTDSPPGGRSTVVTWRTLPPNPAERTVIGLFLDTASAAAAVDKVLVARPPALVAAELCDRTAGQFLVGEVLDATRIVLLRLEGQSDDVARGGRAAWQAVELAHGLPRVYEREWGAWAWRAVHPNLDGSAIIGRITASPRDMASLLDQVDETSALLGEVGARAHVALGVLYAYLPLGPRLDQALAWLDQAAASVDGQLDMIAPGGTAHQPGGDP